MPKGAPFEQQTKNQWDLQDWKRDFPEIDLKESTALDRTTHSDSLHRLH